MARNQQTNKKPASTPIEPYKPFAFDATNTAGDLPGVLNKADISAVFAVANGRGNEDQQRRCINAIMKLTRMGDQPYRPDDRGGERDTVFACGMMHVGQQIAKIIKNHAAYLNDPSE